MNKLFSLIIFISTFCTASYQGGYGTENLLASDYSKKGIKIETNSLENYMQVSLKIEQELLCKIDSVFIMFADNNEEVLSSAYLAKRKGRYGFTLTDRLVENSKLIIKCLNPPTKGKAGFYNINTMDFVNKK